MPDLPFNPQQLLQAAPQVFNKLKQHHDAEEKKEKEEKKHEAEHDKKPAAHHHEDHKKDHDKKKEPTLKEQMDEKIKAITKPFTFSQNTSAFQGTAHHGATPSSGKELG